MSKVKSLQKSSLSPIRAKDNFENYEREILESAKHCKNLDLNYEAEIMEKPILGEELSRNREIMLGEELHKMQSSEVEEAEVKYISWEDLTQLKIDGLGDMCEIIKAISDESDWKKQFEAIDKVRRLNKYDYPVFLTVFSKVINKLLCLLSNLRSGICKNALILINEVLSNYNEPNFPDTMLCQLIKLVIKESGNQKKFLRREAELGLQTIAARPFRNSIMQTLISESVASVKSLEACSQMICQLIESTHAEVLFIQVDWNSFLLSLTKLFLEKKEMQRKKVNQILSCVEAKMKDFTNINFYKEKNLFTNQDSYLRNEPISQENIKLISEAVNLEPSSVLLYIIIQFAQISEDCDSFISMIKHFRVRTNKKASRVSLSEIKRERKDLTESAKAKDALNN